MVIIIGLIFVFWWINMANQQTAKNKKNTEKLDKTEELKKRILLLLNYENKLMSIQEIYKELNDNSFTMAQITYHLTSLVQNGEVEKEMVELEVGKKRKINKYKIKEKKQKIMEIKPTQIKTISYYKPTKEEIQKERNKVTKKVRERILIRDNYTCQICGLSRYDEPHLALHVDHIIPVSKGGKSVDSNLQCLCWICNQQKGNKINYT